MNGRLVKYLDVASTMVAVAFSLQNSAKPIRIAVDDIRVRLLADESQPIDN